MCWFNAHFPCSCWQENLAPVYWPHQLPSLCSPLCRDHTATTSGPVSQQFLLELACPKGLWVRSTDLVWGCNIGPSLTLCTNLFHNWCLEHDCWWTLYLNSSLKVNGNPSHFSPGSSTLLNSSTVPLTMSYWQPMSPFTTFNSFLRVESSTLTLTTSHLYLLWSLAPRDVHPIMHITWHSSLSLPMIFTISIWWV